MGGVVITKNEFRIDSSMLRNVETQGYRMGEPTRHPEGTDFHRFLGAIRKDLCFRVR